MIGEHEMQEVFEAAAKARPKRQGWIGVDLDGTLAHYDHWRGVNYIGPPVQRMLARVLAWLEQGKDVRIFTARCAVHDPVERMEAETYIREWCVEHIGRPLKITCRKDMQMIELWDDRCVSVVKNTGEIRGVAHD